MNQISQLFDLFYRAGRKVDEICMIFQMYDKNYWTIYIDSMISIAQER